MKRAEQQARALVRAEHERDREAAHRRATEAHMAIRRARTPLNRPWQDAAAMVQATSLDRPTIVLCKRCGAELLLQGTDVVRCARCNACTVYQLDGLFHSWSSLAWRTMPHADFTPLRSLQWQSGAHVTEDQDVPPQQPLELHTQLWRFRSNQCR